MVNKKIKIIILLGIILLIAAFLRLYRISDYMIFLGDEGRDALIVKRMIVDHKFTLLGPITSVGLMYLGPAYYYFMAPFLWLSGLDPVGPAVMVALFSLAAIVLLWKLGRDFFSERAGIIAGLLYGLSPMVITYSHFSWNPNILPFWGLLLIYSLLQVTVRQKYSWMVVVGASLGIALQLHYTAFVYLPIIILTLVLTKTRLPVKYYLIGVTSMVLVLSPFILFELRHGFINTQTVLQFVTRSGSGRTFALSLPVAKFWDLTVRLFWRLVMVKSATLAIIYLGGIFAGVLVLFNKWIKDIRRIALINLFCWYIVGISLLSLYTGNTYDYYLMFAFPLPFLLSGIVISTLFNKTLGKILAVIVITILAIFEMAQTPILKEPNRLVYQTRSITNFILQQAKAQSYNFALIAGMNSDHAYRYFMDISSNPPVVIKNPVEDPERQSVAQQLFVVCEEKICQPLGHPLWEIAGFGRAEIVAEWNVELFKVFKLVPYTGNSF